MSNYGKFHNFCRDSGSKWATIPVCNLFNESPRRNRNGNGFGGCDLIGIRLGGDDVLANLGSILVNGIAILTVLLLIWLSDRKRAAVGRREIQYFLFGYLIISICSIFTVGGFPIDGAVVRGFTAVHIATVVATTWVLLLNALLGFQLIEDGTVLSIALVTLSSLALFIGSGYIALDTGFSYTGYWNSTLNDPNRAYALYTLYLLIPLLFLVLFFALEFFLVVGILGERRPLLYLIAAGLLFALGQIFQFAVSVHICNGTNGRLNGSFFETLFTLLAVVMTWVFWSSITEDDWPTPGQLLELKRFPDADRTDGAAEVPGQWPRSEYIHRIKLNRLRRNQHYSTVKELFGFGYDHVPGKIYRERPHWPYRSEKLWRVRRIGRWILNEGRTVCAPAQQGVLQGDSNAEFGADSGQVGIASVEDDVRLRTSASHSEKPSILEGANRPESTADTTEDNLSACSPGPPPVPLKSPDRSRSGPESTALRARSIGTAYELRPTAYAKGPIPSRRIGSLHITSTGIRMDDPQLRTSVTPRDGQASKQRLPERSTTSCQSNRDVDTSGDPGVASAYTDAAAGTGVQASQTQKRQRSASTASTATDRSRFVAKHEPVPTMTSASPLQTEARSLKRFRRWWRKLACDDAGDKQPEDENRARTESQDNSGSAENVRTGRGTKTRASTEAARSRGSASKRMFHSQLPLKSKNFWKRTALPVQWTMAAPTTETGTGKESATEPKPEIAEETNSKTTKGVSAIHRAKQKGLSEQPRRAQLDSGYATREVTLPDPRLSSLSLGDVMMPDLRPSNPGSDWWGQTKYKLDMGPLSKQDIADSAADEARALAGIGIAYSK